MNTSSGDENQLMLNLIAEENSDSGAEKEEEKQSGRKQEVFQYIEIKGQMRVGRGPKTQSIK